MNAKLIAVVVATLIAAPVAMADIDMETTGPTTDIKLLYGQQIPELQQDDGGGDVLGQIQEPEADIFVSVQAAYDAIDDAGGFIEPDADVDADTDY